MSICIILQIRQEGDSKLTKNTFVVAEQTIDLNTIQRRIPTKRLIQCVCPTIGIWNLVMRPVHRQRVFVRSDQHHGKFSGIPIQNGLRESIPCRGLAEILARIVDMTSIHQGSATFDAGHLTSLEDSSCTRYVPSRPAGP
jgi:hypothetical protein